MLQSGRLTCRSGALGRTPLATPSPPLHSPCVLPASLLGQHLHGAWVNVRSTCVDTRAVREDRQAVLPIVSANSGDQVQAPKGLAGSNLAPVTPKVDSNSPAPQSPADAARSPADGESSSSSGPKPNSSADANSSDNSTDAGKGQDRKGRGGGSGRGGGGGGGPGFRPSAAATAGSIGVYTGLVGTAAVILAGVTNIDLVSAFHWRVSDLVLGLSLIAPLQLVNVAIMAPTYSDWKLPSLNGLGDPKPAVAAADADGSNASSSSQAKASSLPEAPAANTDAPQQAQEASTSAAQSAARAAQAKAEAATIKRLPKAAMQMDGMIPASQWGKRSPSVKLGAPTLTVLRDAMHLTQGHYVSSNPTARLSPPAEIGVLFLDCLAGEMLYRGVALTLAAHWICDRLYEAGSDDIITLSLGSFSTTTSPDDLSRWIGAGLVMLYVATSVARKVGRTLERTALVLELAGGMPNLPGSAGGASGSDSGSSSDAATARSGATSTSASGSSTVKNGRGGGLKVRPAQGVPAGTFDALIYAAIIQGTRDASQTLALNAAFILTGNLAASYIASIANQLVLSALQRFAMERMRKRSRDMARELRVYQEKLKLAAQGAKVKTALDSAVNGDSVPEAAGAAGSMASAVTSSSMASMDATDASSHSPDADQQIAPGPDAVPTAVSTALNGAAAASSAPASAGAEQQHAASGAEPRVDASHASASTSAPAAVAAVAPGPMSRTQRTLSMLDALVPDPPKPEKAKKASAVKAPAPPGAAPAPAPVAASDI